MRKLIITIAILLIASIALAGTMYIHLDDGSTEEIDIGDIVNITFGSPDTTDLVYVQGGTFDMGDHYDEG